MGGHVVRGSRPCLFALSVSVALLLGAGCTHTLRVVNISEYSGGRSVSLEQRKRISLNIDASAHEQSILVEDGIVDSLRDYADRVTVSGKKTAQGADVIAEIALDSQHEGSAWNFLITWPGFVIFTPAWNGYVYSIHHDFDVTLREPASGETLDSFKVPVDLRIRHADFDRTFWSEGMGWCGPGWSVIALVSAPFHCQYDPDVTPLAAREALSPVGKFVAKRIVEHINKLESPPEQKALPATVSSATVPVAPPQASGAGTASSLASSVATPAASGIVPAVSATGRWMPDGNNAYNLSQQQRSPLLVFAYASGVDQQETQRFESLVCSPAVADFAKGWLLLTKIDVASKAGGEAERNFARQLVRNNRVDKFPLIVVLNGSYQADYTFTSADLQGDVTTFLAALQRLKGRTVQ